MEVRLSSDVQQKLLHSAARQGAPRTIWCRRVLNQYLADEARLSAVTETWSEEETLAVRAHLASPALKSTNR